MIQVSFAIRGLFITSQFLFNILVRKNNRKEFIYVRCFRDTLFLSPGICHSLLIHTHSCAINTKEGEQKLSIFLC